MKQFQSSFRFEFKPSLKCEKCGADVKLAGRQRVCRPCRNAKKRESRALWYKKNLEQQREKGRIRMRALNAQRRADGSKKDINRRHRKAARSRYQAQGLTKYGKPRKMRPRSQRDKSAEKFTQLHRDWRRRWLRETGPAECVLAWYAGTGKPWNNPRLTGGEKFTVRYRTDDVFRAREIIKAQQRKKTRAERVARLSDGSVTPQALGAAFGEAKFCAYCLDRFESSNDKTADHVEPLYLGGSHSMDNIVIACLSCNSSKGRKRLLHWLTVAPQMSSSLASISSRSLTCSA
jgi:hypothetical protein